MPQGQWDRAARRLSVRRQQHNERAGSTAGSGPFTWLTRRQTRANVAVSLPPAAPADLAGRPATGAVGPVAVCTMPHRQATACWSYRVIVAASRGILRPGLQWRAAPGPVPPPSSRRPSPNAPHLNVYASSHRAADYHFCELVTTSHRRLIFSPGASLFFNGALYRLRRWIRYLTCNTSTSTRVLRA